MSCDEARLIAFLNGSLDPQAAQDSDAHLLVCEVCWEAVRQDREGRRALERLREPVPPELADWLRLALEAETAERHGEAPVGEGRSRRPLRALVAGVLLSAAVASGAALYASRSSKDPAVVAAVLRLADDTGERGVGSEALQVAGYGLHLARQRVAGHELVMATSPRPFPMMVGARMLGTGPQASWVARRGELAIACVAWPVPMLIAGRLPVERLAALVPRLSAP